MFAGFSIYIEWIELESFFSGFIVLCLIALIVRRFARLSQKLNDAIFRSLPLAYAIVGTLYLGLQLRNSWEDHSLLPLFPGYQYYFLKSWALIALLCWIPFIRRNVLFAILHSSVYFFVMARDLIIAYTGEYDDSSRTSNDWKIFSVSIGLNLVLTLIILLVSHLLDFLRKRKRSMQHS